MPNVSLRDIHEGHLLLEDTDEEHRNFAIKSKNLDKGKETIEKNVFLK